jgi:hypothetical protein
VVQLQTDDVAPAPALTTCGECVECVENVPGISQSPQGTSRPRTSHVRLGLVKPQSNMSIPSLAPDGEPDSSPLLQVKPVETGSFYSSI